MNTCRFCKQSDTPRGYFPMIQYSVRHYAHANCGLAAKGVAFFANLTDWQCYAQFPYKAARDHSPEAEAELIRRCKLHEAAEKAEKNDSVP